jgi:hypothetical protein
MSEQLWLPDGEYVVPSVGPSLQLGTYPESSLYVENGQLGVDSALWGDRQLLSTTFRDPRAARFADIFTRHQLRLLDVRQLSTPERFETRDGAGRMDRLTTLLDSGRMVAEPLGGTFEQVVQVLVSDASVTVGSHRLGDHLEGDYSTQSARDTDIGDYITRSGLLQALVDGYVCDSQGNLAGSPYDIFTLAQPNTPRRHDIVECPRPYSNADRDPFTWIEGLYLLPQRDINEAMRHLIRAEVQTPQGIEERIAYTDIDTARQLYLLSVRHQSEHWGNAEQNLVEELVSTADKHRLLQLWPYSPIDYLRISESEWFASNQYDEFANQMYRVAERVSQAIKRANIGVQHGETAYNGPGARLVDSHSDVQSLVFRKETKNTVTHPVVGVYDDENGPRITVKLPKHKVRQPIDPLVATPHGLQHTTEIDPELKRYAERQLRWVGAYSVSVRLQPSDDIDVKKLRHGVAAVNQAWHFCDGRPAILDLGPMGTEELTDQLTRSRKWVASLALPAKA